MKFYIKRYDPYNKMFTREYYDFEKMKTNRKKQIEKSLISSKSPSINSINYGLILSTLGRQGSPKILDNLVKKLDELNKDHFIVLMSEIFPDKLKLFNDQIDT
jgi:2-(3-amino-3-carboxypropyl)histidine synthase